jgi:PAS domain S-box-containing protein
MRSSRLKKGNLCFLAGLLAATAGIGTSLTIAHVVRREERARIRLRFEHVSADRIKSLESSLQSSISYAEAVRAFFMSSNHVERGEFHSFVQNILDSQSYIVAVQWVPAVAATERSRFEAGVRREGHPGFVITDSNATSASAARDGYYPVLYSEPSNESHAVLGLDYGSIPACREAMQAAQRLGRAQAARVQPLRNVQGLEDSTDVQIFIPVYAHGDAGRTRADSIRVCSGFVSALFRTREMTEHALASPELAGVDMSFFEEAGNGEKHLIWTRWSRARPEAEWNAPGLQSVDLDTLERQGFAVSQRIDVAGLRWWVTTTPAPEFFSMNDERVWRLVLLGGIALSVVMGYILMVTLRLLLNREERARLHLAAVVESSADAIYTKSLGGNITSWNQAAERLLGYSALEIIGKPVLLIQPSVGLQESSKLVEPRDNETRTRQYETVRIAKDGRSIDVSLSVSPIRNERGYMIEAAVIARDITEQKHVERLKDDFIHLASHQLRTPLSALRLYSDMLLEGYAGDLNVEQHDYLGIIATSTQRMADLVGTLLNISRIDSQALMVRPVPTYFSELLLDVVNEMGAEVEGKRIQLEVDMGSGLPLVPLDPVIVHEILINLLTNAVKYTPEGGAIHVELALVGDRFVTSITDTGCGISQEDHDRVFSRFYRGENIRNEHEGSGMGLYLVKSLCELSGCQISFESEPGHGTTFRFSVPQAGMKEKSGRSQLESISRKERFEYV